MWRPLVTAASGLDAARLRVGAVAHNLANLGTERFRRQTVTTTPEPGGGVRAEVVPAPQPGPAPEADLVELMAARHAFAANLAVFRTTDRMAGTLLDERA